MKIGICDDDSFFIKEIRDRLESFSTAEEGFHVSDFCSTDELIEYYRNGGHFDILFINIEMRGINGIEAAEIIRALSPRTIIIFVSAHSDYIFDAFRLEALHFLVKPVRDREWSEVFGRAINKYRTVNASIILKWESTRNKIGIDKISFVEGYRRHLTVHTADGVFEAVGKLSEMQELLSPHGFVRVHQGFIVNMNYIKSFKTDELELTDGTRVPVSVRKRQDALKIYDNFIEKQIGDIYVI